MSARRFGSRLAAGRHVAGVDVFNGAALGVIAFAVGYVLTGLATFVGEWPTSAGWGFALIVVGFTFYSAHNVRYVDPIQGPTDLIAQTPQPDVPVIVYYAIPIVLLVGAGVLLARRSPRGRLDPVRLGATAGSLALGYLAMAVVGTFVFTTGGGSDAARLVFSEVLLFGLAYPLVFGAIGVALVQSVDAYRGPA